MKKIILSLVSVSLLAVPVIGLAQEYEAEEVDIMDVLENIANWALSILLIVAAIFIIVAGYFFVTAAGDPDKTKKARDFVLYALIGVLVGFVAKGLVMLIEEIVFG